MHSRLYSLRGKMWSFDVDGAWDHTSVHSAALGCIFNALVNRVEWKRKNFHWLNTQAIYEF